MIDCLSTIPEWDFHRFNDTYYEGGFFTLLGKNLRKSRFHYQALVKLHDTEITILKKGYHWGDFWQEMSERKRKEEEQKRIRRKQLYQKYWITAQSYAWHFSIAAILAVAISGTILSLGFHASFFALLRFCVASAFGLWAWKAHIVSKPMWRNAFGLLALLYNPFLPVELGSSAVWASVNLITLGFVFASAYVLVNTAGRKNEGVTSSGKPDKETLEGGSEAKPIKKTQGSKSNTAHMIIIELEKLRVLLDTEIARQNLKSVSPILYKKACWFIQADLDHQDANTLLKIVNLKSEIIRDLRMVSQNTTVGVPFADGLGSMKMAPTAEFTKELFREYEFCPDKQAGNRG